jgi:outer membrane protein TolC
MWIKRLGPVLLLVCFGTVPMKAQSESIPEAKKETLSLQESVATALDQNPELKAMQKDVDAAHEKISQARSWDDPQIGVRLYQVPFNGGVDNAQDIDYIVAQKIPFPGKKKAASQVVYHDYLHHIELLGARGRQILREVKTAYFDLYAIQQLIAQSRKVEGVLKGIVQTAQTKLAIGEVLASDPIQAQGELAKILVEREPLSSGEKPEAKLNQLMARSSEDEIRLPSQVTLPRWNLKLEESIEIATLRHSSVKLAEHNIGQKEWALKAAKREYLPDLNAQMEYVQRPGAAANAWTGEFMINIPLLVKKKMKGVSQAEAELASARYSQVAAKNDVTYKVKEVFARMLSAEKVMKINQGIFGKPSRSLPSPMPPEKEISFLISAPPKIYRTPRWSIGNPMRATSIPFGN